MRGTTSAHAENTFSEEHAPEPFGNYLRARGEYCSTATANSGARELPPRTRRIPFSPLKPGRLTGTTSAHAENTPILRFIPRKLRNYLRARGEYSKPGGLPVGPLELPPRTRRILNAAVFLPCDPGTTSAHAENTLNQLGLL